MSQQRGSSTPGKQPMTLHEKLKRERGLRTASLLFAEELMYLFEVLPNTAYQGIRSSNIQRVARLCYGHTLNSMQLEMLVTYLAHGRGIQHDTTFIFETGHFMCEMFSEIDTINKG